MTEALDMENVEKELDEVRATNAELLSDIGDFPLDFGRIAMIKLETFLDLFVAPESRPILELEFERRMNPFLVNLAAQVRQYRKENGLPQSSGLVIPQ